MGRRLILDSSVLIAADRGRIEISHVVSGDDDAVVAAITVAECLLGVLLSDNQARRAERQTFLDDVLVQLPAENYTSQVAAHHAELLAHTRRAGKPRGAHDLIIAATARATNRLLISTDDRARFAGLPGVQATIVTV